MTLDKRLVRLSDVQPTPTRWLWRGRIPLGAITVVEGDPGEGKSSLTYDLAARVTRGRPMPFDADADAPAGVILLQGEDTLGATVRPLLAAVVGDLERVIAYDKAQAGCSPLVLPDDLGVIEAAAAEVQARLVVIDPLTAFLGTSANSERAIRRALGPLAGLAERAGLAVVLVRHLTKGGADNPLYRGAGGIAIIAAARSALLVAADQGDDPRRRVVAQIKPRPAVAPSVAFRVPAASGGWARIEWLGEVACAASDLGRGGDRTRIVEAMWILYSLLRDGPLPAAEVFRLAAEAGVSRRTLERAKQTMQVATRKEGSGVGSRWVWELPDDEAPLRPAIERDRAERLRVVRRELAGRQPGDAWRPPSEQDTEVHQQALAERGLAVVQVAGQERLLRAGDVGLAATLGELVAAASEGEAGAKAALQDMMGELGIEVAQANLLG
jgi:hypothetical protein